MSGPAPLIEREAELGSITELIESAATGAGSVVLISGEAGIGKTSLTRAVARVAGNRGARVLAAACDDLLTSRPLGPIRDLADRSAGPLRAALADPAEREDLLNGLRLELTDPPHPVLLIIEDAHWADDATVDVLAWLTRRIETYPVLLVLTYRPDDVTGSHALMRVLGRLSGVPVRRLPLQNLTRDGVAALVHSAPLIGDATVDPAELFERTGGNAFFVTEILANPSADVPPTVAEAVLARVRGLTVPAQQALQQLCVMPSGARHHDLEMLLPDAAVALTEAELAGMVVVTPQRITFRHELARRGLLGSLPVARIRQLHRAVLDMLLARDLPDPALLLHHADALGDRDVLVRFGPRAARDAAASGAHRQAVEHYRRILREEGAFTEAERADLLEGYAHECYLISDAPAAVAAQQEAVELLSRSDDRVALGTALRRLARLFWYAGLDVQADQAVQQALDVLADAGDAVQLAWAHSNAAQLAMLASRDAEAGRLARVAVELARATGDQAVLSHSLNTLGIMRWREGQAEQQADQGGGQAQGGPAGQGGREGQELLAESLRIALAAHLQEEACRAYVNLIGGYLDDPDYPAAEQLLVEALAFADDTEQHAFVRFLQTHQAQVYLQTGRWAEALVVAQHSLDGAAVASNALSLSTVAAVRVRTGDDAAGSVLKALSEEVRDADSVQRLLPVAVVHADHLWLTGRAAEIPAVVQRAWDVAQDRQHLPAIAELAYWRWKAGVVEAPPAGRIPWNLQLVGRSSDAAAEWARLGCPYERSRALLESGSPGDLETALTIADGLGAEPLAKMIRATMRSAGISRIPRRPGAASRANPAGLTGRQLEILALLTSGLTNAEIAARLVLSVRTVDHHVAAVLEKLQVPTRRAAAARAIELGLAPS
ncbi:MAG: AAA family ATPase [Nakamurella sp.]